MIASLPRSSRFGFGNNIELSASITIVILAVCRSAKDCLHLRDVIKNDIGTDASSSGL